MSRLMINGGKPLKGDLSVHGAKNAVLPILAASILCDDGVSVIHNCPDLRDVATTIEILKYLGVSVTRTGHTLTVDARSRLGNHIPKHLMQQLRSSIIFMGAIVARKHKAKISLPGGCELGPRPIDLHIKALQDLGCKIKEKKNCILIRSKKMKCGTIHLAFPSVGATENAMLTSCLSPGITIVENAAKEPEIIDLACFLNAMGACICGAGTNRIEIHGVSHLHAADYTIMPDRIAAITYLCCAATTGGDITLHNVISEHMEPALSLLAQCGCLVEAKEHTIHIAAPSCLTMPPAIVTEPYPGFPTDAQSLFLALLTTANGIGHIRENIFSGRFKVATELRKMGAAIALNNNEATITGVPGLHGATVKATDLRGGAALVIAALGAQGTTEIENLHYIDRGYDNLTTNLTRLGADIHRI
ncbi:MAG: UDP-N-acetylglucosamine 1-carboxyvinyltransferase [Ruminococcaceae bacterium]|nr:UDP-N-acetylglucosamine 1-carboxyvinyltransferase [Oscillospiraceae bacterium]